MLYETRESDAKAVLQANGKLLDREWRLFVGLTANVPEAERKDEQPLQKNIEKILSHKPVSVCWRAFFVVAGCRTWVTDAILCNLMQK